LVGIAVALVLGGVSVPLILFAANSSARPVEAATTVNVSTTDFVFAPQSVTINVGDTVRWTSNGLGGGDISNHTTTSDPGVTPPWHGSLPPPNTEFSVTFDQPGTYTYHCEIHPVTMKGTVNVLALSPTATATPTATPTATVTNTATPTASPIPNATPVVSAGVSPIGGPEPLQVALDWTASDADAEPLDVTIDWGDASAIATPASVPPYAPQQDLHSYVNPGSYLVTLQAQDALGAKATFKTTVLVGPDLDADEIPDAYDNCPSIPNTDQVNSDRAHDNGPGLPGHDLTVPNAIADSEGDACETDGDIDNDGLADTNETPLANCGAFNGAAAGHPRPAGGDVTNDDDGDAFPAPPLGTDNADDGPSWDTDNDGVLDGYECANGANPRDALSRPPALPDDDMDDDGDGLHNRWERAGWGTQTSSSDSDGDGRGDCREAADVTGDAAMNFPGDVVAVARASINPGFGRTGVFDLNKDGTVNFPGDAIESARRASGVIPCL
jgi:plastocyanin